jgi:hypothetical protein
VPSTFLEFLRELYHERPAGIVPIKQELGVVDYLKWLKLLASMGDKLPAIIAWIQQGFELFGGLFPSTPVSGGGGVLQFTADNPDVIEAEAQVAALLTPAGSQAAFDGSRLRNLFKFLNDSGLLTVLIGLLGKGAFGG